MNNVNYCLLGGNLTKDAETKYLPSGTCALNFSIAANRVEYKGAEKGKVKTVSFFMCELYGKRAEALAPYLKKGVAVIVSGHLKQDTWQNTDGKKTEKVKIVCNEISLLVNNNKKRDTQEEFGLSVPVDQKIEAELDDCPF